jgi:hypothetical protein
MDELNDPQLESMLGRLSGAYPDANVAFVTVRGKVRQAKRRRAFVATTAACAMLLGVGVVAAQTGGGAGGIEPSDGLFITVVSSHVSDTEVEASEVSIDESTEPTTADTDTTAVESTMVETTVIDAGNGGNGGNGGAPSTASNSGHGNNNSTTSTAASTKPSTKPTVPSGEQTTSSKGGSLTFLHDADTLTFVSVAPADGFHEDESQRIVEPGRLRVEFTDGTTTWRIDVRLDGGKAPIETSQQG